MKHVFLNCLLASCSVPVVKEIPLAKEVQYTIIDPVIPYPLVITNKSDFIKLPGNTDIRGVAVLAVLINKNGVIDSFNIVSLHTYIGGCRIFMEEAEKVKLKLLFEDYIKEHISVKRIPGVVAEGLTEFHLPVKIR